LKRYVAPQSGATIKNLLENKGGYSLPKYMGYDLGSIRPTLLEEIRQAPILTKPGTEWHRSPENTSVLQLALEDASGKPFQTLMMKVMGGGKSKYMEFPDDETYVDIAKGSTEDGTEVQHGGRVYPELAAAGLWTNANEYARFLANLMACAEGKQNAPWKQETAKIAFETIVKPRQQGPDFQAEAVSFGFATDQSRTYYFRGGSTLGYYCQSWMYPRTGSAIVVFTNRQLAWPFCNEIRDTFIGKLFEY
jgi:CubicO group peptidase (beta-lactamase class C family)